MGSSIYSSRADTKIPVRYDKPPRQRLNACKSYQHCLRACLVFFLHAAIIERLLLKLFKRMLDQFDRLRKRNAFLEQYKKEKMFEHGLEEFDDARYGLPVNVHNLTRNLNCVIRATCEELLKEYKACESPDYITYVSGHCNNLSISDPLAGFSG